MENECKTPYGCLTFTYISFFILMRRNVFLSQALYYFHIKGLGRGLEALHAKR